MASVAWTSGMRFNLGFWHYDYLYVHCGGCILSRSRFNLRFWHYHYFKANAEEIKWLVTSSSAPWTRDVWCIKRVRTALDVRIIGCTNWSCRQQEKKKVVGKLTSFNPGKTMFKLLAIVAVFYIQAAFCTCKFATDWVQFRCVHGYTFSNFEPVTESLFEFQQFVFREDLKTKLK
jgi:hypothetical protein